MQESPLYAYDVIGRFRRPKVWYGDTIQFSIVGYSASIVLIGSLNLGNQLIYCVAVYIVPSVAEKFEREAKFRVIWANRI